MIQLFRKILCPIDFSEHSLAALDLAIKVVQQNDAKLCLLNVVPLPAGAAGFQPVPMDPYPFAEKERQEQLVKLARQTDSCDRALRNARDERRSGERVLNAARESGCRPHRDGHARSQGIEPLGPRQRRRASST